MIHQIVAQVEEKQRIIQEKLQQEQEAQFKPEPEEPISEHEPEFDMWAELNDHNEPVNLHE